MSERVIWDGQSLVKKGHVFTFCVSLRFHRNNVLRRAQLVKQSLSISEVCCSNPVIGIIYIAHFFSVNCIEKTKIKKKAGNGPFKKQCSMKIANGSIQTEDFCCRKQLLYQ